MHSIEQYYVLFILSIYILKLFFFICFFVNYYIDKYIRHRYNSNMKMSILEQIGLTSDQAETYALLLENGSLTPKQLMDISSQNRTTAYMSLSKIEDIGLAKRDTSSKKLTYLPISPTQLETILDAQSSQIESARADYKNSLPELLGTFYSNAKNPVVTYYEGSESLSRVYEDHLKTGETVYFVRTPADEQHFGDALYNYMHQRAEKVKAFGISPYTEERYKYAQENDRKLNREMTWCKPADYDNNVEISIYGNKTAFISFGDEVLATIIDSPQIAQAMKQLFKLAQSGSNIDPKPS